MINAYNINKLHYTINYINCEVRCTNQPNDTAKVTENVVDVWSFGRSLTEELQLPAALKGSFLPRQLGHPSIAARWSPMFNDHVRHAAPMLAVGRSLAQKRQVWILTLRGFRCFGRFFCPEALMRDTRSFEDLGFYGAQVSD